MDFSAILDAYTAFLKRYGAKDCHGQCCVCGEFQTCVPPLSVEMADAVKQNRLSLLTDQEMVEMHSSMGPDQFMPSLHLWSKVEELGVILPAILSTDISSGIDFGCGPGFMSIFLAKYRIMSWRMAGLDGSETLLEHGQKMAKENNVEIYFHSALADHTSLPDKAFDLVTAANLIDCSSNWRAIVREMARVAKKRVVIYYGLSALFRYIDPFAVLSVLSETMIVDSPEYVLSGGRKDSVKITAHNPAYVPKASSGIMLASA
jgi:2-polyprenyl-3-methyl-5-hydroxy-6-metoxy-1,4-benzoquinol methylase